MAEKENAIMASEKELATAALLKNHIWTADEVAAAIEKTWESAMTRAAQIARETSLAGTDDFADKMRTKIAAAIEKEK